MPKICTQFHALPEELVPTLRSWITEPEVRAYFLKKNSNGFLRVSSEEIGEVISSLKTGKLALTLWEADLEATTIYSFVGKNFGALVLDLGSLTDKGLEESALMTIVEDPAVRRVWSKFDRQLKALMPAGVVVQSLVIEGHFEFDRTHRCSTGTKSLAEKGTKILGLGTGYVYRPDLPPPDKV